MDRHKHGRVESRGTILVASASRLFADIIGELVVDSGFTPAYPTALEPARLSVARTQPCIVICDCNAPVKSIQRLILEVSARRIPVLLSPPQGEHRADRALTLAHRVGWLTFPISRDAFSSTVDALLSPVFHRVHRVTAGVAGVRIDAGVGVRTLRIVRRGAWTQDDRALARIGHTDALENERADDDGMALLGFGPARLSAID